MGGIFSRFELSDTRRVCGMIGNMHDTKFVFKKQVLPPFHQLSLHIMKEKPTATYCIYCTLTLSLVYSPCGYTKTQAIIMQRTIVRSIN